MSRNKILSLFSISFLVTTLVFFNAGKGGGGKGGGGSTSEFTEPGNLEASLSPSSCLINISWTDQSSDEVGFELERSIDGDPFVVYKTLANNISQSVDDTIPAGSTLSYRIRAYKEESSRKSTRKVYSNYSNISSVTLPPAPLPPSVFGFYPKSASELGLYWKALDSNASAVQIQYKKPSESQWKDFAISQELEKDSQLVGLPEATTYQARARTSSLCGQSQWTETKTAQTFFVNHRMRQGVFPNLALVNFKYFATTSLYGEGGWQVSLVQAPQGVDLDPNTGTIEWLPSAQQVGSHLFKTRSISSSGMVKDESWSVEVISGNVVGSALISAVDGGRIEGTISGKDDNFPFQLIFEPGAFANDTEVKVYNLPFDKVLPTYDSIQFNTILNRPTTSQPADFYIKLDAGGVPFSKPAKLLVDYPKTSNFNPSDFFVSHVSDSIGESHLHNDEDYTISPSTDSSKERLELNLNHFSGLAAYLQKSPTPLPKIEGDGLLDVLTANSPALKCFKDRYRGKLEGKSLQFLGNQDFYSKCAPAPGLRACVKHEDPNTIYLRESIIHDPKYLFNPDLGVLDTESTILHELFHTLSLGDHDGPTDLDEGWDEEYRARYLQAIEAKYRVEGGNIANINISDKAYLYLLESDRMSEYISKEYGPRPTPPTEDHIASLRKEVDDMLTCGGAVHGRVVDDRGKALSGAKVVLTYQSTVAGAQTQITNANGEYSFKTSEAGRGGVILSGFKTNYEPGRVTVAALDYSQPVSVQAPDIVLVPAEVLCSAPNFYPDVEMLPTRDGVTPVDVWALLDFSFGSPNNDMAQGEPEIVAKDPNWSDYRYRNGYWRMRVQIDEGRPMDGGLSYNTRSYTYTYYGKMSSTGVPLDLPNEVELLRPAASGQFTGVKSLGFKHMFDFSCDGSWTWDW